MFLNKSYTNDTIIALYLTDKFNEISIGLLRIRMRIVVCVCVCVCGGGGITRNAKVAK